MSGPTSDAMSFLVKQGIFATMLIIAAAWFGQSIVIPMRDDQKMFMNSVIETNKINAGVASQLTEVQKQQAATLGSIQQVLTQIRDDQRHGVWKEK